MGQPEIKTQTAVLKIVKHCKHSVRFDDESKEPNVISSVYLLNEAYEALGKPEEIKVVFRRNE